MDFFLSVMDFFPVLSTPCSSLSDPWCYLQTPCVSVDFFLSVVDFFPVIHSWACVHQSSIFRVVDVLCAVTYSYGFFLCAIVFIRSVV